MWTAPGPCLARELCVMVVKSVKAMDQPAMRIVILLLRQDASMMIVSFVAAPRFTTPITLVAFLGIQLLQDRKFSENLISKSNIAKVSFVDYPIPMTALYF
jgi:hypothetical protein